MKYQLKSVYNPLEEDFVFQSDGEDYIIPAKSILVQNDFIVVYGAKKLAEKILEARNEGVPDKEQIDPINHPEKAQIIQDLLGRPFKIVEGGEGEATAESKIEGESNFKCDVCGFEAKSEFGLQAHKRKHK